MAKRLDNYAKAFRESTVPFLLAEVLTDGAGEMVDLLFREVNAAAEALLHTQGLRGKRFKKLFPTVTELTDLQTPAFSSAPVVCRWTAALETPLTVIGFPVQYGLVGCILDAGQQTAPSFAERLPGAPLVLELGKAGVRLLSFGPQLEALTKRTRRELLDYYSGDFSALFHPQDWPEVLQALMDAERDREAVERTFRLCLPGETVRWVELRAMPLEGRQFCALLLDADNRSRAEARQQAALETLELERERLMQLFDALPCGCAVLRRPDAETPWTLLAINQALSKLLGCSKQALQMDLLRGIPAADQPLLLEETRRAWARGQDLHRVCFIRREDGTAQWALVETARKPRPDGGCLLFVSCANTTREREAEAVLHFRAQLCELLLDEPRVIRFEYDPKEDTARISARDAAGLRTERMIPNYLRVLERSELLHPEDRPRLIAALRRASGRGCTDTAEYRVRWDGGSWRWYRVSWVSITDSQGQVCHLLGRGEECTRRRAEAERFRTLRQQRPGPRTLLALRLDLTENRVETYWGRTKAMRNLLTGSTASECLSQLEALTGGPSLSRKTLLEAYERGTPPKRYPVEELRAETELELLPDPESGHVIAFCTLCQAADRPLWSALMACALVRIVTKDGLCRAPDEEKAFPLERWYPSALGVPAPDLLEVRAALESAPETKTPLPHGRAARWSYLDGETLLLIVPKEDRF